MGIEHRLNKITYQELRNNPVSTYNDEDKLKAVQSLYDSAINTDTIDLSGIDLPTQSMGVDIIWSGDKRTFTLENDYGKILNDNLVDDIVPGIEATNLLLFEFDGESFELRTGDAFELRTA